MGSPDGALKKFLFFLQPEIPYGTIGYIQRHCYYSTPGLSGELCCFSQNEPKFWLIHPDFKVTLGIFPY